MYIVMADRFGGEDCLVCVLPLKRDPTFLNFWTNFIQMPGILGI